jgi:integrase
MPVSVHIYRNLMDYRKHAKLKTNLNDYVFFPEYGVDMRDQMMDVVAKLFKRIVAETHVEEKTDKKFTLYSLRHTAIMMRLTLGQVDTLALARNARTSQAMIDKFYAAHLTTDQVRKQLHAFTNASEQEKIALKNTASKKRATSSPRSVIKSIRNRSKPVQ